MRQVIAPKAAAVENFERSVAAAPMAFSLLCSSVSAVAGYSGQVCLCILILSDVLNRWCMNSLAACLRLADTTRPPGVHLRASTEWSIIMQANYAAANAALDAYAAQQAATGVAAVAVQWGAWSAVGEAVTDKTSRASL